MSLVLSYLVRAELEVNYRITKKSGKSFFKAADDRTKLSARQKLIRKLKQSKKASESRTAKKKQKLGCTDLFKDAGLAGYGLFRPSVDMVTENVNFIKNQSGSSKDKVLGVFKHVYDETKHALIPGAVAGLVTGVYANVSKSKRVNRLSRKMENYLMYKEQERLMDVRLAGILNSAVILMREFVTNGISLGESLTNTLEGQKEIIKAVFNKSQEMLEGYIKSDEKAAEVKKEVVEVLKARAKKT